MIRYLIKRGGILKVKSTTQRHLMIYERLMIITFILSFQGNINVEYSDLEALLMLYYFLDVFWIL